MASDQVKLKKELSTKGSTLMTTEQEQYPYGTSLSFSDELVEEVGLDRAVVGEVVEIRAFAYVESMSDHKSVDTEEGGKHVRLQLTSVKVQPSQDDRAEQLYGPNS